MGRKTLFFVLLFAWAGYFHFFLHPSFEGKPLRVQEEGRTLLLVPLDSRPPCRLFPAQLGRIAGVRVQTPETELLDYYSMAGDTAGLRAWLLDHLGESEGAILSIDQLLYGGLIAAREKEVSEEEMEALTTYLRALHRAYPDKKLYAFSILPRLLPQDTIDGYEERRALIAYSRLLGRAFEGQSLDETERIALKAKIKEENIARYERHFIENEELNKRLALLVKEGVLTQLVLGQDDGERYGIPNIEKAHLREFLKAENLQEPKVFLTHGADEIALTMVAGIVNDWQDVHPRVKIAYNAPQTAERIMPFMAATMRETAEEKIRIVGGMVTEEGADYTLYLFVGTEERGDVQEKVQSLKRAIAGGEQLALVDLSEHFRADETILPHLIAADVPLNRLSAYAGWNTASNAIGTAVAQGSILHATVKTQGDVLEIAPHQIAFLQNRILEDQFYLKSTIDSVNHSLKKAGYTNTSDLDLAHNAIWANAMLRADMDRRIAAYKETRAVRAPFPFPTNGGQLLCLKNLTVDMSYPWPRTFEIYLEAVPTLEVLP